MVIMDKICIREFFNPLGFIVALKASVLRCHPVAVGYIFVAYLAFNTSRQEVLMVKTRTGIFYRFAGSGMTTRATAKRFALWKALEMAQVATGFGYRNVLALDYLRMATGTAQLLTAPHLNKMGSVVKD
jgi:hypothetical protein